MDSIINTGEELSVEDEWLAAVDHIIYSVNDLHGDDEATAGVDHIVHSNERMSVSQLYITTSTVK